LAKYDYSYIRSLIREIRVGDSDAFAALFAATCQNQYHRAYAKLQNEYDTQDVLQKTYSMILASDSIPSDPKVFLSVMDQYNDLLCSKALEAKGVTSDNPNPDKAPDLDIDTAETMLDYILHVNHWNQSSFKLETLADYNSYRKSKSTLQRVILAVIIVFFCCLPVFFLKPGFTLTEEKDDSNTITYRVSISAILPIEHVTAVIGNTYQQVSKENDGTYVIHPATNGEMTVDVTLISRQYKEETISVTDVDETIPEVTDKYMKDGMVHLFVKDDGSGIDYDSIYAITDSSETVLPSTIDKDTGEVTFPKPDGSYNVYISDNNGNQLHLILTITPNNG
jgi:hypothetical protein